MLFYYLLIQTISLSCVTIVFDIKTKQRILSHLTSNTKTAKLTRQLIACTRIINKRAVDQRQRRVQYSICLFEQQLHPVTLQRDYFQSGFMVLNLNAWPDL